MLLYVAGPYRAKHNRTVDDHIATARAIAIELWEAGHAVICPHLNTAHMEHDCSVSDDAYLAGDLVMLARCDGIVMTPLWEESEGARAEQAYASELGMPIWVYPNLPALHPTELRAPMQVRAFAETLGRLYRTHLSKNADYSPANILATGEIGLVTRLWDKTARLMNLAGFRVHISHSTYEAAREPKHEAINDTYEDLACYGVIGLLLRQGKWGH